MCQDGSMAKLRIIAMAFCLFGFVLAGCYHESYKEMGVGVEVPMGMESFSSSQAEKPFDRFPYYRIVPGDILDVLYQIRSWEKRSSFRLEVDHTITVKFPQVPTLTETQKIRPDGKISLPYIDDVLVMGKTTAELKAELMETYASIFQAPEILILVPEFRARVEDFKKDLHTAPRGLSRLVTVRPDGYVTFPLIGDILVANKTLFEVRDEMAIKYEKVMPDLQSDLFLEKAAGSVVFISGKVRSPGAYTIKRPVSVLEAITLAGGHTYGAQLESIIVIRKSIQLIKARKINLEKSLKFNKESIFFYLQPNDIVFVPTTAIFSAAELARSIGDITFFNGWGVNGNVGLLDFTDTQIN